MIKFRYNAHSRILIGWNGFGPQSGIIYAILIQVVPHFRRDGRVSKIRRREGGDTRREKSVKNARSIIPEENEELFVVYQWYEESELLV